VNAEDGFMESDRSTANLGFPIAAFPIAAAKDGALGGIGHIPTSKTGI
jgi:hypothetical protein